MKCLLPASCLILLAVDSLLWGFENKRETAGYITTPYPVLLLSANDGEMRFQHTATGLQQSPVEDSITVIRLGPDHPPIAKTVTGTVPVTICGSPRVTISADGCYGFVSSHDWRPAFVANAKPAEAIDDSHKNVLTVIDLAADDLKVVDQLVLPGAPWMVALHPDGRQVVVSVGAGFHVYAVESDHLVLKGTAEAPAVVQSFDVSPRGDRILAVTMTSADDMTDLQLHLFSLQGNTITHLQRVEAAPSIGPIKRLFSPRFSPDSSRAIVLNDNGEGGKGTLDDVLIVDLGGDKAAVTERVLQVADGLEDVAFHPSGRFAVVCCLENGLDFTTVSHLAVIDVLSRPARLISHTPIEVIPEGIGFTKDGSQLFVGATAAQHIAVFDVEGMSLRRNPLVLRTGHGPAALAVGVQVSFFDSQGVSIAYTDAGHGEPIVMIHGGFNSLDGWLSNPFYTELINAGYRVIVPDCRGHGRSGKPHDVTSYGPEMADDIVRLLDHLEIQQAHVIGYSMGGDIAHKLRERHPNRLITCIVGGAGRNPTDGWAAVDFEFLSLAESLERGDGALDYLRLPLTLGEPAMSQRDAEGANVWFMKGNDALAMGAMIRGYAQLGVSTESLEKNTVPTLLIAGELDPEKLDSDKLKDVMANLEYMVIPQANHFTAFQCSEFSQRILDFLDRHRGK